MKTLADRNLSRNECEKLGRTEEALGMTRVLLNESPTYEGIDDELKITIMNTLTIRTTAAATTMVTIMMLTMTMKI